MAFFLIFLVACSIATAAIFGIAYLNLFYNLFLILKVVKLSIEYRLKYSDNVIFIFIFFFFGICVFAKDFFIHYYFIGKIAHSEEVLLYKIFLYCITSLFALSPSFSFVEYIYRTDSIRTIFVIGYGISDAYALNWISNEFVKENIGEANYLFLMSFISTVPLIFIILKELLSFDLKSLFIALKEARNVILYCLILACSNLIILRYLKSSGSNYFQISSSMVNVTGMIFYFAYKSYAFGNKYEEKIESMKTYKGDEKKKVN